MHMLSTSTVNLICFLYMASKYQIPVSSYLWCLLGRSVGPIYIPCAFTQRCGYIANDLAILIHRRDGGSIMYQYYDSFQGSEDSWLAVFYP